MPRYLLILSNDGTKTRINVQMAVNAKLDSRVNLYPTILQAIYNAKLPILLLNCFPNIEFCRNS